MKLAGIVGLVMACALALACWRIDSLGADLDLERAEHRATKDALAAEVQKGLGWLSAYESAVQGAFAQATAGRACLAREAQARGAAKERAAIVQIQPDFVFRGHAGLPSDEEAKRSAKGVYSDGTRPESNAKADDVSRQNRVAVDEMRARAADRLNRPW